MASLASSLVVMITVFGCMLIGVVATNDKPQAAADGSDSAGADNATDRPPAGCPPGIQHVGLRYVVAKFNFSHVQTPFIVAAWILFVTLAKIGRPTNRYCLIIGNWTTRIVTLATVVLRWDSLRESKTAFSLSCIDRSFAIVNVLSLK